MLLPPVGQVAVLVELPALVVEAVGDLVPNDPADPAVVHVGRPVVAEKVALRTVSILH